MKGDYQPNLFLVKNKFVKICIMQSAVPILPLLILSKIPWLGYYQSQFPDEKTTEGLEKVIYLPELLNQLMPRTEFESSFIFFQSLHIVHYNCLTFSPKAVKMKMWRIKGKHEMGFPKVAGIA